MINSNNQSIQYTANSSNDIESKKSVTVQLNKIPLFVGINDIALKKIALALKIYNIKQRYSIIKKGESGEHLVFLLSGRLQVNDVTDKETVTTLFFMTAGDYFGELSIIDGLPHAATLVACEPSVCALLPRADALNLILSNPVVSEKILKKLAQDVRQASNFRIILGIPNAFQRVYALLNYFSKTSPGGLVVIDSLPTQQEISIMINTSRETVSRALQVLIQNGVVEKDMRRLIIRKPENLRDEANTSKLLQDQLNPQIIFK